MLWILVLHYVSERLRFVAIMADALSSLVFFDVPDSHPGGSHPNQSPSYDCGNPLTQSSVPRHDFPTLA